MNTITFTMCLSNYITMLTLDIDLLLLTFHLALASEYKQVLREFTVLKGQAFHIYHVIRSHWFCVAWTKQKWHRFHFHLHFHHGTPCQAWVGSKGLFPPWKEAQFQCSVQGASVPSSPLSLPKGWSSRARDRLALCFSLCDSLQQGNVTLAHHHASFCTFILFRAFKRFISL